MPGWRQSCQGEGLKKGAELTADAVAEYRTDDWFAIRMDKAELNDQIAAAQAQLGERVKLSMSVSKRSEASCRAAMIWLLVY